METAIIGFLGILIGILLTELFRRRSWIEIYSTSIFEKRIALYEELMRKLDTASGVARDVIENPEYASDERQSRIFSAVISLDEYVDQNPLHLNEELGSHCVGMFLGVDNIYEMEDEDEKIRLKEGFWKDVRNAKSMVKKESGAEELNRLFKSITRAKHSSPLIDRIRELRRQKSKTKISHRD